MAVAVGFFILGFALDRVKTCICCVECWKRACDEVEIESEAVLFEMLAARVREIPAPTLRHSWKWSIGEVEEMDRAGEQLVGNPLSPHGRSYFLKGLDSRS